jgi:4a-hydroxytetrahydrobiopterin dehydratase
MELIPPPPGWSLTDTALEREFIFPNFVAAFAFMTQVAALAESLQHHPTWTNTYNQVHISLTTHDQSSVTELDYRMAKQINNLI